VVFIPSFNQKIDRKYWKQGVSGVLGAIALPTVECSKKMGVGGVARRLVGNVVYLEKERGTRG